MPTPTPALSVRGGGPEHRDVLIPGGAFEMGDAFGEGYASDGELPVHGVRLSPYRIDALPVTNAQFARFVDATGHVTDAERFASSAVFHLFVDRTTATIVGRAAGAPWWLGVRGADWAHPTGPRSSWREIADHPVVHVSHDDALAYCRWAGRSLPTEAQWEHAARGGLEGRRYAWGDDLLGERGEHLANIWQGTFPTRNSADDGYVGTSPVGAFPPNGYGLHDTAGNVWEWCADWFSPHTYRNSPVDDPQGPKFGTGRVTRGGSYLCHDSYCNRYRVAARTGNTPDSSSGNCGFRTVVPVDAPD
jgi:formylglycine-generating enzyme required for sulfatase activity